MNRNRTSLLILLFFGLSFSSYGQVACPPNIDFELGNTTIWNYFTGTCCPISATTATAAVGGRHTLTTGTALDPFGFFPIVPPGGGSYAMRLGNSSVGAEAEKARYFIRVPSSSTAYSLIYRYAVVLQDAGHAAAGQPRFLVSAYDSLTGAALPCAQYNYVATSTLPGFYHSIVTSPSDVYFKSWTTASINLSGMAGRTIGIDFASGDCSYSGHFGYGYFDMSCGLFAISTIGCDSTSAVLTAPSGFSTYRWYDSSTFATVIDTLQTITLTMPSAPTTYAVIMIPYTGYGCPDTLYTRIIPSRLALHKMNDTTICFGASGPITLNTGATDIALPLSYAWSASSGSLSCSTCATPVVTPTTSTTYRFTVTDAVGCSATDSIRIFGALISASIVGTSAGCYGEANGTARATVTSGIAPYTYTWSTTPTQYTATATGLPVGTYTLNVVDSTGCNGIATVTITSAPPRVLSITSRSNPTTCGGSDGTITLSGVVAGSTDTVRYTFTPTGGTPTTVTVILGASSSGTIVITGLAQGTYSNIAIVTGGCPYNVVGPVTLTDPAPPSAPSVSDRSYCQYDVPSALSAGGSGLTWYSPGSTSGSSTAPTPSTTIPGVSVYTVTSTVANCVSTPSTITVTVIAKPSAPIVHDTSYCQFATAAPLSAIGLNLKWYTTASGGTALGAIPTPGTATVGTTTWYVSQTVNGCESDRSPISATILYLPSFDITPSRPFTCQFDTLSFSYSGPSMTDAGYQWHLASGNTIVGGSLTSNTIVVNFDSLRQQTITLTASSYNGRCVTTDTIRINVVPRPTASCFLKENICEGDTITVALDSRSDNADHYFWNFDGGNVITANSNTGGPYKIKWNNPGVRVVHLTAYTVEGCEGKEVLDTIKVLALPEATIMTRNLTKSICLEDSLFLSCTDSTHYGNTYLWTPEHYFRNTNRHSIWGKMERIGYVTLTVTDPFGCRNADSILISPDACCKVSFPNAFTPNNDGKNDVFRPVINGFHRFHSFRIANRWGQTIFESANSKNEWDGTYNGVPQDLGVYYYYIKFDCGGESHEQSGDVTLLR